MQTKTIQVVVPKETHELGQGIVETIKIIREALANGFQIGQDGAAVLSAVMQHLVPAIQGFDKISEEMKSTKEFSTAIALLASDMYGVFQTPAQVEGQTQAKVQSSEEGQELA